MVLYLLEIEQKVNTNKFILDYNYMKDKNIKFLFCGCGSIGKSLIELWMINNLYKNNDICIIDPEPMPEWLLNCRKNIKHIQIGVTKNNIKQLFKKNDKNTLVIDLTVEVDSFMIIDECIKTKSMYINTSLENWHDDDKYFSKKYQKFKEDTLYYREMLLEKKLKNNKRTIVTDFDFNPGQCQMFALTALDMIAKELNVELKNKEDYGEFCKKIELESIQIVEFDNQKTDMKQYDDCFYNSWSSLGFQSEGSDHCMFGYGTIDETFDDWVLIEPTEGEKNIRFIGERSMNLLKESVTLGLNGECFNFNGMLITHGESNTLSQYLTTKDKTYRPSVYYVYSPCKIAWDCLDKLRDNDYKFLDFWYILQTDDISNVEDAFDSIGALLTFKNGKKYWSGSVLSHKQVLEMGFKYAGTATTVQVCSSVNSAIEWILRNPNKGYNSPEFLNHREVLKATAPYLGSLYFGWIC